MRCRLLKTALLVAVLGNFSLGANLAFGTTSEDSGVHREIHTPSDSQPQHNHNADKPEPVPDVDVLALDDNITSLLDKEVRPLPRKIQRLNRLHTLLYSPDELHIQYLASGNYSATETFHKKAGNCVSLANLFIAAARYVGLDARYQFVEVEPQWQPQGEFFQVPGHINVVVTIGGQRAEIEFNGAYFDAVSGHKLRREIISDTRAKAELYNNLGVEKLSQGKEKQAIAYFDKAISFDKRMDFTWSNRGVAYKHLGNFDEAERSYRRALKLNPRNNSAIKNIYILYSTQGDKTQAKKFAKRVEKYARKNPYYLAKLAQHHMSQERYKKAIHLLKSAIKIHPEEAEFHHYLGVAYFNIDKNKKSRAAFELAKRLSDSESKKAGLQAKIDALAANM